MSSEHNSMVVPKKLSQRGSITTKVWELLAGLPCPSIVVVRGPGNTYNN